MFHKTFTKTSSFPGPKDYMDIPSHNNQKWSTCSIFSVNVNRYFRKPVRHVELTKALSLATADHETQIKLDLVEICHTVKKENEKRKKKNNNNNNKMEQEKEGMRTKRKMMVGKIIILMTYNESVCV